MKGQAEHILVLEDDPKFRIIVEHALRRAGYDVTTVTEATKALMAARESQFDLIISDYYLPDYPGTDFIRLLREIDSYEQVPVIMWSARAWELNERRLREELSVLIMSKGCSVQELLNVVTRCLDIARSVHD